MFELYDGRESRGSFAEEFPAYLGHQPPCDSLPTVLGRDGKTIDVAGPGPLAALGVLPRFHVLESAYRAGRTPRAA